MAHPSPCFWHRLCRFVFLCWSLITLVALNCQAADSPLRVLIFSGQNNHKWQETTPELQRILGQTGRFSVTVTEHPEACTKDTFADCNVILSNWNTFGGKDGVKEWPAATREAFLEFVRNGGGYVVVHAGGTEFLNWPEYQKLIGGVWGKGTGHGPAHPFTVKLTNANHPITRGVASFETTDELWHRMVLQPAPTILATAFSAPDQKGTGNDEPMILVTEFGKGRCFNLVLGHDVKAMQSPGFQTLLRRGTEWAATGKVTQP